MKDFLRRRVNAFDVVIVWGGNWGDQLTAKGQQKLATIAANTTRIKQLDSQQAGGGNSAHGAVGASNRAFEALRKLIKRIHDTADSIDFDDELPDIADDFPLPAGRNLQTWLTAATTYAQKAAPHTQLFIDYGMEANFLTKLSTVAQQANDAEDHQDAGDQSSSGATKEMDRLTRITVRELRSLRSIVNNIFGPDAETADADALQQWVTASHIEAEPEHAQNAQGGQTP